MVTGDRGVARRAKTGGFGGVPLGFATDAPRGSAGSFTPLHLGFLNFWKPVPGVECCTQSAEFFSRIAVEV